MYSMTVTAWPRMKTDVWLIKLIYLRTIKKCYFVLWGLRRIPAMQREKTAVGDIP